MPNIRKPRCGSLQFWPRKRSKRAYSRLRSFNNKEAKPNLFAGYKVGMTHLTIIDNRAKSDTKGEEITCPATIIECPPLKSASVRFYKKTIDGLKLVSEVFSQNLNKELGRKISIPKKINKKIEEITDFDEVRILVYTQPKLTGIGKKKPELFEACIGGKKEDALKWIKENLGKEININDVLKEGQQLDIHAITKGKGFQGPVKRFGIALKQKKSEKGTRRPGSLGPWRGQGHVMWKVAQAGQTGYHQRMEMNKLLLKIGDKGGINPKSGFTNYGITKNQYVLVKGSIAGAKKRLVIMTPAMRQNKLFPQEAPSIKHTYIQK